MKITDKMLHFSISFSAVSTVFLYCYLLNLSLFWSYFASNIIAIGLGILKEIIDKQWDWKDIMADGIGIITSDIFIAILAFLI